MGIFAAYQLVFGDESNILFMEYIYCYFWIDLIYYGMDMIYNILNITFSRWMLILYYLQILHSLLFYNAFDNDCTVSCMQD